MQNRHRKTSRTSARSFPSLRRPRRLAPRQFARNTVRFPRTLSRLSETALDRADQTTPADANFRLLHEKYFRYSARSLCRFPALTAEPAVASNAESPRRVRSCLAQGVPAPQTPFSVPSTTIRVLYHP